jgi:tRNA(adenine34) deaminase
MCAGALVLSRIDRLVFGTKDPKAGACGSLFNIAQDPRLNHQVQVVPNILEQECSRILQVFFEKVRQRSLGAGKGEKGGTDR